MFCVKGNQVFCCLILICSVIFVAGDDAKHIYIKTDYCNYKCNEAPYMTTICLRKRKCGPVNGTCEDIGGTVEFRTKVLEGANYVRNQFAQGYGLQFRYANPGAARMNALSYDLELEYMAQCYVNTCKNRVEKCVSSVRFPYAKGFIVKSQDSILGVFKKDVFDSGSYVRSREWFYKFDLSQTSVEEACHINQLLIIVTLFDYVKYIGCGAAKYTNTRNDKLYYCLFGLAKNPEGKPVFISGEYFHHGEQCEIRNQQYSHLCGNIEPIPTEPSWTNIQSIGQTNVYLDFGINPASTAQSIHFIYYRVHLLVICLGLLLHVIITS